MITILIVFESCCTLKHGRFITFKYWANVFPYGDGTCAVELTKSQLHVEEWYSPKYSHESVWDEKGSCKWQKRITLRRYSILARLVPSYTLIWCVAVIVIYGNIGDWVKAAEEPTYVVMVRGFLLSTCSSTSLFRLVFHIIKRVLGCQGGLNKLLLIINIFPEQPHGVRQHHNLCSTSSILFK